MVKRRNDLHLDLHCRHRIRHYCITVYSCLLQQKMAVWKSFFHIKRQSYQYHYWLGIHRACYCTGREDSVGVGVDYYKSFKCITIDKFYDSTASPFSCTSFIFSCTKFIEKCILRIFMNDFLNR